MGYFKSTVKGVSWVGGFRIFTRGISFFRTIIIARILVPSQFGVYSIATLVLSFLEIITETGINVFLIQEDNPKKYLNTAWIVSIARGLLISFLIFVSAPFISEFFNSPDSRYLIQVIAIVPIVRGFINPSIAMLQKDLQFGKDFFIRTSVFVFDSTISVIATLYLESPVGIVYGLISGAILEVIITWIMLKPVPILEFDLGKFKKVISSGKWVTASGIFNYMTGHIDDTFVGRMLGTGSLGVYQMAYRLSTLPLTEVTQVFNKVTFPVFTKIQDDKPRLKKAFIKTLLVTVSLTLPISVLLFFGADLIIPLVLGDNWLAVIPILKVLSIFGVIRSITGSTFSVYLALKKQIFVASILFIEFLTLTLLLYPFVNIFGLMGAAYSTIIAVILPTPLNLFYLSIVFRKQR